ncbi:MAG: nitrilase-related carbon-nitrogen hydrolase, partial [Clostridia bacterium]|nr:nitrilase-related carbon-nitrogen hydrolase [Clostridia bacterium]
MQHGFLKIAAVTPPIRVAGCEENAAAIIACIERARADGARLVALPELCVTGYTCGDLFRLDALLDAAGRAVERIRRHTEGDDTLVLIGAPLAVQNGLYNCALVLQNGRILGVIPKTHLPNYGEFYEKRVFTPAPDVNAVVRLFGEELPFGNRLVFRCREMPAFMLGVEVCEDIWSPLPPSTGLCAAGATLICNLSASDEAVMKPGYRRMLIQSQ